MLSEREWLNWTSSVDLFEMSLIGYKGLLYRVSQELVDVKKVNQVLYASSSAGLISENSESFNKQVSPGENIAVIVMKLFSDLEENENLGLDNLEILRDLLKGVKVWYLVDEVDKFERQRKDFNSLLETTVSKLDELYDLEQIMSLCEDHISEDAKDAIKDVSSLVKELQKKNRLGVGQLTILRKILKETGQQELLDLLTEFEQKWKEEEKSERRKDRAIDVANAMIVAPATAVCSTFKHTWEQIIGAVNILCRFSTVSGISLAVGTGIILQQGARVTLREFVDAFKEAVLPAATDLRTLSESSLCFTVQAENDHALKALWERYQDGTLQKNLQEFLVTDDIRQLSGGEEVILSAYIDEQEYNNARLSISIAEQQGRQNENQEISPKRIRRNSDSSLHVTSNERLIVLKLREEEINLYQEKIKHLKDENEKLRAQVEQLSGGGTEFASGELKTGGMKRFRPTSDWLFEQVKAYETTDSQRPTKRRRRNSDSDLYCKTKDEEIRERDKKQEQLLADEKYSFVQRYLEQAHDTRSVVTVTSDSGFVTEGTASEVGQFEDYTDHTPKISSLTKRAMEELQNRIAKDPDVKRHLSQSFGISVLGYGRHIFRLFPDTPVKPLKDVFEALQLYDLLELLEDKKPPEALKVALTLEEIKKLRGVADLPTTYHSCGAVLLVTDERNYSYASGLKTFFTNLDKNSDVTILTEYQSAMIENFENPQLPKTGNMSESERVMLMLRLEEFKEKEDYKLREEISSVISRWIRRQDEFSFFAVIAPSPSIKMSLFDGMQTLLEEMPSKLKFFFCRCWGLFHLVSRGLETLLVDGDFFQQAKSGLLLEILNKRWQTLDLKSMMSELKRSSSSFIRIIDNLSLAHRFEQKEDKSLS